MRPFQAHVSGILRIGLIESQSSSWYVDAELWSPNEKGLNPLGMELGWDTESL